MLVTLDQFSRTHRAPCWQEARGPFGLRMEIRKMPDFIVHMQGSLFALTAVSSSDDACQLLKDMTWGTNVDGARLMSDTEIELAFLLIDTHNLTARLYV